MKKLKKDELLELLDAVLLVSGLVALYTFLWALIW